MLVWLICQAVFGFSSTVSTSNHFFRFGDNVSLQLIENPAVAIGKQSETFPENSAFNTFENSINEAFSRVNDSPNWIRVIVKNPTGSTEKFLVRYGHIPTSIHLYFKDAQGNTIHKIAGALVKSTDKTERSFHGCEIELNPGIDTLYFYNSDTWHKFPFTFIEIANPEDRSEIESDFYNSFSHLTYALFAFIILLIFQLLYVIIQAFYHRRIEYGEYIFYLLTLLVYFTIRYELTFNISLITFGEPSLRRLLNDLMLFLPFAFYLRFSRHFIGIAEKFPIMNKTIYRVETAIFICAAIFIILFFTRYLVYETILTQLLIISLSLYSLRLIIFFIKQRNRQIWFILAGSLAATTGHLCGMMLSWFPVIRDIINVEPIYFTMGGLAFEIFFFNTGLGYKAKSEQAEKVNAQDKLIMQLEENRKMQLRLESMRNRIARDLHDDVGSTLSSIGLYSEVGIDQIGKNTQYVKGILEKISESSQRMMTAMNDIVWAIHSRHDEGEGLVERIKYYADERLTPAGINFNLTMDRNTGKLKFSMEARRNILLIFKEAINNAAKHSGTESIECSIAVIDESLICSITDYGKGLNVSLKQDGNGLLTMESRAAEMKGEFKVLPLKESGTSVVITLPLSEIVLNGSNDNSDLI